ncbi:unnamed protein product [Caenorhabditis auriculariae]|uniref:VWFA domain-containing protein n=1 Tax=Caenorhabditis auriculariae TaxID=2777116 RepID=A0A8S1H9N8_9PELO|nr:unnamed protein product [Caenorhabditis auriculariae]
MIFLCLRDSQLTDYDISDFNPVEASNDGSAWQETHFNAPQAIQEQHRRTTADSDDYVKITEPIYDYPPRNEKAISPHEAAQLQELAQEYDFGLDIPGVASPPVQQPQPAQKELEVQHNVTFVDPFGRPIQPFEAVPPPQQVRTQQASPPRPADQNVRNLPINIQRTFAAPNQQQNAQQTVQIQGKDDPKNLADAEMFVQDALEYLGNQDRMGHSGGFVMEEEMLSSHGGTAQKKNKQHSGGAEATSRQIKTTDVFERVEHDEHDDMTYAPEIQSVEIPPDQLSENSDNLLDYFDHVAAEGVQAHPFTNFPQGTLKKNEPTAEPSGSSLKPVGRAPQILPAFGNRAASSSSLASGRSGRSGRSPSGFSSDAYPHHLRKQSSVLSVLGVTSMQEMLLTITSLDSLSDAMRRAGLETTNMIFGIDYTASNKYQGEDSFGGRSLHTIHPNVKNPYQQVITILGRTLAPFASTGRIGVYGFGDAKTGDWATFPLKPDGDCYMYNEVTPTVALSGPTNFAPLIYQAMEICQKSRDYHILVIIADGQVTNEKATRRAIVQACQHPLSIIVVGVGDGPWDMMKVFDESLPKRPWDNFHFVEFHEIMKRTKSMEEGDVKLAVQSLLEIPDQYRCVCELGLLTRSIPPRGSEIRRQLMHNPL